MTTSEYTQCLCNHATFFGSLNVRPNPIDPPTFAALKKGYAMLIFVSVIFLLYFIALIWARRKDRADVIKVTIKVNPSLRLLILTPLARLILCRGDNLLRVKGAVSRNSAKLGCPLN